MKKLITIFIVMFSMSFSSFAEMNDRQKSASGNQMRSSQSTQMMSHEMMRDMTRVMDQMQTMTRDMNRIMEKTATMDQTRTREMSRIMEQLSLGMHKMSQYMAKGEMNKKMLQEMEQHIKKIRVMIKNMEQN